MRYRAAVMKKRMHPGTKKGMKNGMRKVMKKRMHPGMKKGMKNGMRKGGARQPRHQPGTARWPPRLNAPRGGRNSGTERELPRKRRAACTNTPQHCMHPSGACTAILVVFLRKYTQKKVREHKTRKAGKPSRAPKKHHKHQGLTSN